MFNASNHPQVCNCGLESDYYGNKDVEKVSSRNIIYPILKEVLPNVIRSCQSLRIKGTTVIVIAILTAITYFVLGISTEKAEALTNLININVNNGQDKLSIGELALLTIFSVFSPGISLFRVAYHAQEQGASFSEIQWLIYSFIAIVDWVIDKIPGYASLYQFLAHGIIWSVVFLGYTYLASNPSAWIFYILGIVGSVVQLIRQIYTIPTDATVVGAPVRSLSEDTFSFLMFPFS